MGKRGRPGIGPRDRFCARPTAAVGQRIREEADKLGISHGELISRVMSDYYGLPHPTPAEVSATIHQLEPVQEFPMTG